MHGPEMNPISEKAAELLFSRYLLQALGLRKAQLFAPSSWEERKTGYDQSIVGLARFREVNLQFKSPEVVERWSRFTVRLSKAQHHTLRRLYPERTAFYVAHTFTSLKQVNEEQMSPNLAAARDFLKNFICIDAHALPIKARSVHYLRPEGSAKPQTPTFKSEGDGSARTDGRPLEKACWFRGDALLDALGSGTIGRRIDFADKGLPDVGKGVAPSTGNESDEITLAPSDIGLHIRVPI